MISIIKALDNTYPGRGIIIGRSANNNEAMIAYFIMGRSENSRNRIFVEDNDGEGIHTEAYDPSKLTDPSLVIYSPVRVHEGINIVTNGDQTDTIYDYLEKGETFEAALATRTFEPDPPIYTPRISGIVNPDGSYRLSILKRGADGETERLYYDYPVPQPGEGHLIHTYKCDGDPVPSFEGEPVCVKLSGYHSIDEFTDTIWNSLDEDNAVSVYTKYITLADGDYDYRILNKHELD